MLTRRALLRALDVDAIEATIAQVEQRTTGELRVSVAPLCWGNVRRMAERAFDRLEISSTRAHNGVLIFLAPARRQFVVLGDRGIDELVGPRLWDEVSDALGRAFADGRYTAGLIDAIVMIGEALALHFPMEDENRGHDGNELPNTVDLGRD
jgi:uncharacterized membrane protein